MSFKMWVFIFFDFCTNLTIIRKMFDRMFLPNFCLPEPLALRFYGTS